MISFNEIAGNTLLFFLVFGMSATVDIHCMLAQIKNIKAIMMGIFFAICYSSSMWILVVRFMELDRATGISILVVTSSPGGSYSNWWCSMFNADLALSVTMTAISTLMSVILMPANLLLYCNASYDADVVQSIDFNSLFIALTVVISAIGFGLFASAKVHSYRFNIFANRLGNYAGISLVAFSALMANTVGDTQVWEHTWQFYVGVMIPLFGGLLVANILSSLVNLEKPERVTLSVECCYQNVGIATSVALTMFQGVDLGNAMAVPLFYGIMEAIVLGIYCVISWKAGWTKAPSNISFWTMISTSYEVLVIEHSDLVAIEVSLPKNQKDRIEKANRAGDTLYVKYSVQEEDVEEEDGKAFGCIAIPSYPKEASGLTLPEVIPLENDLSGSLPK